MRQCVILVGGKGSRLGKLTKSFPKPMLEINDKPFLNYILDMISRFGFEEVLLLASHANEVLQEYFDNHQYKNCKIKILIEDEPLGTGGALVNSYDHLDDIFYCLNGDSVIEGNWLSINTVADENSKAVVALTNTNDPRRYGSVELKDNIVQTFNEKNAESESKLINGGIYYFKKTIFKEYEKTFLSLEKDIFPDLVKKKLINGKKINGYFIDIGTPESLEIAKKRNWNKDKKAIIFDRDGTLNEDNGYTYKASDLKWKEGAKEIIRFFNDNNYYVFVATNQAGIAKGKYTENDMHGFHKEMQDQLRKEGAHIDKFYFSPYHTEAKISKYKKDSIYRKPQTGMLEDIKNEWTLKKENMILIGDRDTDVICADNFKIKGFLYNGKDNLFDVYKEKIHG